MHKINEIIKERKFKYIVFFTLLLSVQFIVGNELQEYNVFFESATQVLLAIAKIIILWVDFTVLVYLFIILYEKIKQRNAKKEKHKTDKTYKGVLGKIINMKDKTMLYFIIILLCWLPVYIAFFPLIFSYDGPQQVYNKVNPANPLIHTLYLKSFYSLGINVFHSATVGMCLYAITQSLIMAAIFTYATKFVEKKFNNKVLTIVTLLFFAIFPVNQLFSFISTKDTLFAGLTLLFVIYTIQLVDETKKKFINYILYIIVTALLVSFRLNAIYAIGVLIPFLLIILRKEKLIFLKMGSSLMVGIILYFILNNIISAITNPIEFNQMHGKTSAISQAVARIAEERYDELTQEEKDEISYYYKDIDELISLYNESIADGSNSLIQVEKIDENPSKFYNFVISLVSKYPQIAAKSYLNTIRGLWYINDDSFNSINHDLNPRKYGCIELYNVTLLNKNEVKKIVDEAAKERDYETLRLYVIKNGDDDRVFMYSNKSTPQDTVATYNFLPAVKSFYKGLVCENNYRNIPVIYMLFQPATYFYIVIAYLLLGLYRRNKTILITGMFMLLYFLTCFLGPCGLIRYIYCIIVATPIMISYFFKKDEDTKNKEKI